ncbi:MAG: radical SAM protein [Methanomassiliicoccales archaeon]
MPVFRIAFHEEDCSATICNYGCNWNCSICSYRLREEMAPTNFLSLDAILEKLSSFRMDTLNFVGGEPLTIKGINEIVAFAKNEKKAKVKIAHTNASMLPPLEVDEIGVSLRAVSKRKHLQLTGAQNTKVLGNIFRIHDMGIKMRVSTILIPELIDVEEVEKIAEFIASVGSDVPLHITGYIPVPGLPWRRPTRDEMADAVIVAKRHIPRVTCSILTVREYLEASARNSLHSVGLVD